MGGLLIGLLIGFNYYGLVAEQVDAADLESVALVACGFESLRVHQILKKLIFYKYKLNHLYLGCWLSG